MELGGKSYLGLSAGLLALLALEAWGYASLPASTPTPAGYSAPMVAPVEEANGETAAQMQADYEAEGALLRRHLPSAMPSS